MILGNADGIPELSDELVDGSGQVVALNHQRLRELDYYKEQQRQSNSQNSLNHTDLH